MGTSPNLLKKIHIGTNSEKWLNTPIHYSRELQPLDKLIQIIFKLSVAFFKLNRMIDGKNQKAQDFFKHVNYHKKFYKFYNSSTKQKAICNKFIKTFTEYIDKSKDY